MNFIQFIKTKTFWKHTGLALLTVIILLWGVFKFLDIYTHHNETFDVPDFTGVMQSDLEKFLADKKVKATIIDSVFEPTKTKGSVIRQDPSAGSKVKEGRMIYLTVVATSPPQVEMPKLLNASLKQAVSMLEGRGLKVGKTSFKADECTCVIKQMYKGKQIEPGTSLPKGAKVDLIIGKGPGDEELQVPDLIGLTRAEALDRLNEASLVEGAIIGDTLKGKVYRQIPGANGKNTIKAGNSIDLFFKAEVEKAPDTIPSKKDDNR